MRWRGTLRRGGDVLQGDYESHGWGSRLRIPMDTCCFLDGRIDGRARPPVQPRELEPKAPATNATSKAQAKGARLKGGRYKSKTKKDLPACPSVSHWRDSRIKRRALRRKRQKRESPIFPWRCAGTPTKRGKGGRYECPSKAKRDNRRGTPPPDRGEAGRHRPSSPRRQRISAPLHHNPQVG